MIKKLNLKLIVLECVALIFIISGIDRLYIAYHGELFDTFFNDDTKRFAELTNIRMGDFFLYQLYWALFALAIGIIAVGVINWKNKFGVINSIVVSIITLGMYTFGIYASGIMHRCLNSFCRIFSEEYGLSFLIGGIIILLVGILILWKAIILSKKHNCLKQSD